MSCIDFLNLVIVEDLVILLLKVYLVECGLT